MIVKYQYVKYKPVYFYCNDKWVNFLICGSIAYFGRVPIQSRCFKPCWKQNRKKILFICENRRVVDKMQRYRTRLQVLDSSNECDHYVFYRSTFLQRLIFALLTILPQIHDILRIFLPHGRCIFASGALYY